MDIFSAAGTKRLRACLLAPSEDELEKILGTEYKLLFDKLGLIRTKFEKSFNVFERQFRPFQIIDRKNKKLIRLNSNIKLDKNQIQANFYCDLGMDCEDVFTYIQSRFAGYGIKLKDIEVRKNSLSFNIDKGSSLKVEKTFGQIFGPKAFNENYLSDLYHSNAKELDVSHLNSQEVKDYISSGIYYGVDRKGFDYFANDGSNQRMLAQYNKPVIAKLLNENGDISGYARVVEKIEPDKFLVAIYDGNKIKLETKIIGREVEDAYTKLDDISEVLYKTYLLSMNIKNNISSARRNLKLMKKSAGAGSEEAMKMFQIRWDYNTKWFPEFSPNMYFGLMNLEPGLEFQNLLFDASMIRRKAVEPDKMAGGDDVGLRRISTAISEMHFPNAKEDSKSFIENFITTSNSKLIKESYADQLINQGEGIPIMRLVQDDIELTGYDTKFHKWVHPPKESIALGRGKMSEIYNNIIAKDYSKIADPKQQIETLLSDVAELHWWGAHVMPFKRGSAAIMDLITKYVIMEKGFHPSRWKQNIFPDVKAFTTPLEQFKKDYIEFYELD